MNLASPPTVPQPTSMMHNHRLFLTTLLLTGTALLPCYAQRSPRRHTTTQSRGIRSLEKASSNAPSTPEVTITVEGTQRIIRANGIPTHRVGRFPNKGNPHRISEQTVLLRMALVPVPARFPIPLGMHPFGYGINGVPFDPGAAEWYLGNRTGGWQYEALSGAVRLGLDANHAHVQPTGSYHYHGLPTGLMKELGVKQGQHSPLVGWAADGYPIYALYGFTEPRNPASGIKKLSSSYKLKTGARPKGNGEPGGTYDGTFLQDYEYVPGAGDLDMCNGRFCFTPEYPQGTYAYFLTETWPVIPRMYHGVPSRDIYRRGGGRPNQGPPR